jgi:hypothetical protein
MAVEKGLVPDATPTMLATVAKESMNSSEVRGLTWRLILLFNTDTVRAHYKWCKQLQ